jgi:hypothetical protein
MATPKRKTVPEAKSLPDDPTQQQLLRQLDAQRVKAETRTEAREIAETKAPERPAPPPEYARRDSTLPVLPADETQTALHFLRGQGISNPVSVVSWAIVNAPETVRAAVRDYRLDGSLRAEKLGEPLLRAWREAHHE